jgi:hypothetical protein
MPMEAAVFLFTNMVFVGMPLQYNPKNKRITTTFSTATHFSKTRKDPPGKEDIRF